MHFVGNLWGWVSKDKFERDKFYATNLINLTQSWGNVVYGKRHNEKCRSTIHKNIIFATNRFRCMDLDGDGFLSMYELEYFYEEQLQRMEQLGIETLPFEDCLCQVKRKNFVI